ncbi:NaeI family type II restriction endonuclease [Nonomuraea sp. M3C6]|uniref:NaeI family type II restriction endonuclease n=1 Tax=Nonomuraea marmarensis TaxID=3351344 RepID=A0ABW7AJ90_9ACTN
MIDEPLPGLRTPDAELDRVYAHFRDLDPDGSRTAAVLRRTFDMLLDGPNTGRYRWDQLFKTEKTHCGTLVEINLQREFKFADGRKLDYSLCGIEVDCKYSQDLAKWMIPPEAVNEIILGLWANDKIGVWSAGAIRARPEYLQESQGNRDKKRQLSKHGRNEIRWLLSDQPLPENVLVHMPPSDVEAVFAKRSGQQRLNELLRRAQGRLLTRNVICTVATGDDKPKQDPLKRLRKNGGARDQLRNEGIIILGDYINHRIIAEQLGLPIPGDSEFVSIRLTRAAHADRPYVQLDGEKWTTWQPGDPIENAPELPDLRKLASPLRMPS